MEAEALPVIEGLGLTRDDPPLLPPPAPAVSFSGRVGCVDVHVVCNGAIEVVGGAETWCGFFIVGLRSMRAAGWGRAKTRTTAARFNQPPPHQPNPSFSLSLLFQGKCPVHGVDNIATIPATVFTYLSLAALKPDLVISAGTAGGFRCHGAAIGDVYLGTSFAHHDRRIPLPAFDAYGVWAVPAHPAPNLAAAAGLKSGGVTTGNSLDWHEADMAAMKTSGAVVKEMEAAGIAWACHLFGTPLIALKSVTDIVDGDIATADEFVANLAAASKALHDKLAATLAWLGEGREVVAL